MATTISRRICSSLVRTAWTRCSYEAIFSLKPGSERRSWLTDELIWLKVSRKCGSRQSVHMNFEQSWHFTNAKERNDTCYALILMFLLGFCCLQIAHRSTRSLIMAPGWRSRNPIMVKLAGKNCTPPNPTEEIYRWGLVVYNSSHSYLQEFDVRDDILDISVNVLSDQPDSLDMASNRTYACKVTASESEIYPDKLDTWSNVPFGSCWFHRQSPFSDVCRWFKSFFH